MRYFGCTFPEIGNGIFVKCRIMKRESILAVFLFFGLSAYSQDFNEYKKSLKDEHESYSHQLKNEFEEYRAKINAEYAEYLRQTWEKFHSNAPVKSPCDEPFVPPVYVPELDSDIEIPDEEIDVPEIDLNNIDEEFGIPSAPVISPKALPAEHKLEFLFYGTECCLGFDGREKYSLKGNDENSVADLWEDVTSSQYDVVNDCFAIRERLHLCDWAYYQLAKCVAREISESEDAAVVLTAYIMSNSGYKIRLGRFGTGKLCDLLGTEDGLYNCPSVTLDGEDYYLVDKVDCSELYVMAKGFPSEMGISFYLRDSPLFEYFPSEERLLTAGAYGHISTTVRANRNALDFYAAYPFPFKKNEPGTTWVYHASAPLDADIQSSLYPVLESAIAGKSQREAANMLLNFVQTAFEYKTDEEYWGYERPFFSVETLYYPYSDCEDRAILFSRLIRDLMELDVVFLRYEGHLATAVAFTEDIPGDYIMLDDRKYLVCDPTYINAPIGIEMPNIKLLKAIKL